MLMSLKLRREVLAGVWLGDSPAHPGRTGNCHPHSHESRPPIDANPAQTQPSDTRDTSKVVLAFPPPGA